MPMPIHMAYLVSQYPAISHTFILREVRALRELNFDIQVASINAPDRPPDKLTDDERREFDKTFYLKKTSVVWVAVDTLAAFLHSPITFFRTLMFAIHLGQPDLKRMLFGVFYFVEAVMVARWMRQAGNSHLHVHFATPASMVGLVATHLTHGSLSITVHGPDEFYDVTQHQLAAKIAGCSFLCAISSFARSQLMKLSPVSDWNKFEITPLGVDPARFVPKRSGGEPEAFEILCVGRLVPAKGQHVLLQALELLASGKARVCLRFVGDGPDRHSLEMLARQLGVMDRVAFEGSINQDRIREYYQRASVFVLPSFAEGVPVVLMEAMAMEVPCITTRITGIPELIRDGIDGLLVTPSDHEELARAIQRLMDDPQLRCRLGQAGRRRVQANYDLNQNTLRLAGVFRKRLRELQPGACQ